MARFYLMVKPLGAMPERVELDADGREHALYLAERRSGAADIALWDGERLMASMSGAIPHLWMVTPSASPLNSGVSHRIEGAGTASQAIAVGQG